MNYLGILTTSERNNQWVQNNLNVGVNFNLYAGIDGLVVVCRDVEIGSSRDNFEGFSDALARVDILHVLVRVLVREALACKSTSTSNSAIVSVYEIRKSCREGLGLVCV